MSKRFQILNVLFEEIVNLIKTVRKISVLTGAGISVNAGIPDFRGEKGIYTLGVFPEYIFYIDYFLSNPKSFYDFARAFYPILEQAKPTKTHLFLAELENTHSVCIVTQNIDLLHEEAGSKNVIHLHGSIKDSYCMNCNKHFSLEKMKIEIKEKHVVRCECNGLIKPNIVFFGESILDFDKAIQCIENSELIFVLGTSLQVYPANTLIDYAKGYKILVNKDRTPYDDVFDFVFHGDLDEFFDQVSVVMSK